MKHDLHSRHGSRDNARRDKVLVEKFNFAGVDVLLNILCPSAAQVIDHANIRASMHEGVRQLRADKRGSPRDQDFSAVPIHRFLSYLHIGSDTQRKILDNRPVSARVQYSPTVYQHASSVVSSQNRTRATVASMPPRGNDYHIGD